MPDSALEFGDFMIRNRGRQAAQSQRGDRRTNPVAGAYIGRVIATRRVPWPNCSAENVLMRLKATVALQTLTAGERHGSQLSVVTTSVIDAGSGRERGCTWTASRSSSSRGPWTRRGPG